MPMSKNPVVHFEMPYQDQDRVATFYQNVFGWTMNKTGKEYGGYVTAHTAETDGNQMVQTPGTINGGFFPNTPEIKGPKETRVVMSVTDIQVAMKAVEAGGGKVMGEPIEIPMIGLWVNFTDTEGNLVGMLQAKPRK